MAEGNFPENAKVYAEFGAWLRTRSEGTTVFPRHRNSVNQIIIRQSVVMPPMSSW